MKKWGLSVLIVILSGTLFSQVTDSAACLKYHRGKFSYTDSVGNVVLVNRVKKFQFEKNQTTGVKTQYRLRWINNCEYELTLVSTNSKALRKSKYGVSYVVISKTMGDEGYEYTCACKGYVLPASKGIMKRIK